MSKTKLERLKALHSRLGSYIDHENQFYQVVSLLEDEYATENGIDGEEEYNKNLAQVLKIQANDYLQYITTGKEEKSLHFYQEFVNHFKRCVQNEINRLSI